MDNKMKRLAFDIALRQTLRLSGKSAERTARNLMELADAFSGGKPPEPRREQCRALLSRDIQKGNAVQAIAHLSEQYGLSS